MQVVKKNKIELKPVKLRLILQNIGNNDSNFIPDTVIINHALLNEFLVNLHSLIKSNTNAGYFSFLFNYKKKKVFDDRVYFYKPCIFINFFNIDFVDPLKLINIEFERFSLAVKKIEITNIDLSRRGFLIFHNSGYFNHFYSQIISKNKFFYLENYRKRLKDIYLFITGKNLRNDSLMFKVRNCGERIFRVELWGSDKMIILFNTFGLVDENFESISYMKPKNY